MIKLFVDIILVILALIILALFIGGLICVAIKIADIIIKIFD